MWGVILSEAKDLRDPSALRPQGDKKGLQGDVWGSWYSAQKLTSPKAHPLTVGRA